jgi:hypothetical protein
LPSESAIRRDSLKAGMTIDTLGGGVSPAHDPAVASGVGTAAELELKPNALDPPRSFRTAARARHPLIMLAPAPWAVVFECRGSVRRRKEGEGAELRFRA